MNDTEHSRDKATQSVTLRTYTRGQKHHQRKASYFWVQTSAVSAILYPNAIYGIYLKSQPVRKKTKLHPKIS